MISERLDDFIKSTMAAEKFAPFNIFTATYKTVHDHGIQADVLIPKSISPAKCPIIVRFHGGGLVFGARLFPDVFAQWAIDYALKHSAIIVTADYQLLPEAKGKDLLKDIDDLWKWLHKDFPTFLAESAPGFSPDLTRILSTGESAGGYMAIQLALSQPAGAIRGVIAAYPMTDLASDYYKKGEKPTNAFKGLPPVPESVIDAHLASMAPNAVVSSAEHPSRMGLGVAIIQHGRYLEFLGTEPELFPFERIEHVSAIPPVLILHGDEDSMVPVEHSRLFLEKVKRFLPESKVELVTAPEEHGFDLGANLETPWLKEGLKMITSEWLE
ncbi:Alpha/Beta hydrolase protein [Mycena floridula]|nr:Alpha/Beta hydrolase protein [Mycena floridula]